MKVTLDLFSKAGKTVRKTEGAGFCRGPVSSRPSFIRFPGEGSRLVSEARMFLELHSLQVEFS